MARLDIHRPAQIVPSDYEYVASDYLGPGQGDLGLSWEREAFANHMRKTGGRYSSHEHGGSCHICGAFALYIAKFYHAKTNSYIVTGFDCADKMAMGNPLLFRSFKKRVKAGMAQAKAEALVIAGKKKAQAQLADMGMSVAWDIYEAGIDQRYEENTIRDIVVKLIRYGSISEAQIGLIKKLLAQIEERAVRIAERIAANAASKHFGEIGKRIELDLVVEFVKHFDSVFGMITLTTMKDVDGNVFVHKGSGMGLSKGDSVSIKATIKAHNDYNGIKQTQVSRPVVVEKKVFLAA
jgi:hypothetical protein